MRVFTSAELLQCIAMPDLINRLRLCFAGSWTAHPRQILSLPGGYNRLLLTMPAFAADGGGAVKLSTIVPDNAGRGAPTIQGVVVLFDTNGAPLAILDGAAVTRLRTGAASALASSYLSRPESSGLLIIGTGALAPYMALAHCAVRPIQNVRVWGRDAAKVARAITAIEGLLPETISVSAIDYLETAVADADIVSCATSASDPVIHGRWIRDGAHIDLVGSFSPVRREVDDDAIRKALVFVDTYEGALSEAGDIIMPINDGVMSPTSIRADLAELAAGRDSGRVSASDITLFKSVGAAIEDLATARLAMECAPRQ